MSAIARHEAQALAEERAAAEATTRQQISQQSRTSDIDTQYGEVIARGEEKYDDYDVAMFVVSRLPIPDEVGLALKEAIAESENGEDLLYYLGKHKDEAQALAKLSPARALVKLGEISTKLSAATAAPSRRQSSAPDPISPVKPGSGSVFTSLDDPKALKSLGTTGLINAWNEQAVKEARARR